MKTGEGLVLWWLPVSGPGVQPTGQDVPDVLIYKGWLCFTWFLVCEIIWEVCMNESIKIKECKHSCAQRHTN